MMAFLEFIFEVLWFLPFVGAAEDDYDDPQNISPAERVRRLQEKDESKERSIEEEEQPADTVT